MRRHVVIAGLALTVASLTHARDSVGLEGSVVRIVNYAQRADWSSPWNSERVGESWGSGFVIKGGLVMTNAHVVSDSKSLLIHVLNDPTPHEAEVVHLGHDCDLALIRPKDPNVLKGVTPLEFGGLPRLGSSVDTLGYPMGGIQVTSTRGVVSRIEEQVYVHSGIDGHLAVQTDAATNPGSSGGPVVQDGRVVGVAFQYQEELQRVGFFIPTEVIARFLEDIKDGHYDGYPDLGILTATMAHPAARARAGMADGETGVRASGTISGSSADGHILKGDVMLALNGHAIANDGSIVEGPRRMPFGMLIDRMFIGDKATVRVLRDGKRFDVAFPLRRMRFAESRRNAYDTDPRYFVYGGLIFVPLCRETLKTYGEDWSRKAPPELMDQFFYRDEIDREFQDHERVVLLRRLDDPVNIEMAWYAGQIVERVNGKVIMGLDDLIAAIEQNQSDFHLLEFAHGRRFGVLDRRKADAANAGILERYGIQQDRSR
jgi:S1-C subfamily serine protease